VERLWEALCVEFASSHAEHADSLRQLWVAAFPDTPYMGQKSEQWKQMGWQVRPNDHGCLCRNACFFAPLKIGLRTVLTPSDGMVACKPWRVQTRYYRAPQMVCTV
jgi:hypothetical protein